MTVLDYDVLVYNVAWILYNKTKIHDIQEIIADTIYVLDFIGKNVILNAFNKLEHIGAIDLARDKVNDPNKIAKEYRNYFRITLESITNRMEIDADAIRKKIAKITPH